MTLRAMVVGAAGQDGSYLVRQGLARGAEIVGVDMGPSPDDWPAAARYRRVDVGDREVWAQALEDEAPDRIFHVAAIHGSAANNAYEERFGDMLRVNVESVHVVLEHLRRRPEARLLYASSAKAFGSPLPPTIDESTPRRSDCLYAVTKNAARDAIVHYRSTHGSSAGVLYLFNHESPRRPPDFFIPKLAEALARGLARIDEPVDLYGLDFQCDWGSAEEYMDLAWDVLERAPGEDFVMATGRCVHARSMAEALFDAHGLSLERQLRVAQPPSAPPTPYRVRLERLEAAIGRRPTRRIESVVEEIADGLRAS